MVAVGPPDLVSNALAPAQSLVAEGEPHEGAKPDKDRDVVLVRGRQDRLDLVILVHEIASVL